MTFYVYGNKAVERVWHKSNEHELFKELKRLTGRDTFRIVYSNSMNSAAVYIEERR